MKYLLPSLLCVSAAVVVACSSSNTGTTPPVTTSPDATTPANTDSGVQEEVDAAGEEQDSGPAATPTADGCLIGQDMDAADVDISLCPALPARTSTATMNGVKLDLGAWEIGTTSDGKNYKYGTLSAPGTDPRMLSYDDGEGDAGTVAVNALNVECWAKGYYRLRMILQNPPAEYVELKKPRAGAPQGYQFRFFQFQTDLRNGPTGYKQISSFQDHLVKWVTVISKDGVCTQPTFSKFRTYAKSELTRRGLPQPAVAE